MTGRQLVSNGGFEVISNPTAAVSQWKAQSWSDFASGYQAAQSGGLGNSRCALMEASDTSTYRAAHQTVVLTAADNVRQFTIKASAIMRAFSSAAAGAFLDVYLDVILNTGPAWGAVVLDLRKELANANGQLRTGSWVTATGTYSAPAGSHVTNIYIHPRMRGIQGAACFDDISIQLEEASCLQFSNCNGHGTCEAGECKCQSGYVAPFCCPPNRTGKDCSQCAPGYFGSSCTKCSDAHTTCNGHGTCDDGLSGTGRCKCSSSRFTGEFCQLCGTGFYGPDCLACSDCSGHGTCGSSGACECTSPYSGANCEIACSGHGTVAGTGCNCQSGWTGTTCQQISAPTMKLSYTEDMSIFPNPMRGWYRSRPVYMALPDYARGTLHDMTCAAWFNCPWDHRYCCHVLDPNELRTSRNSRDAMSVVYRGYYMAGPPQHSDTIDPAILALMRADLRAARAAGFTVVWRIAYSSTDNIPVLMQAHGTVGTDVPLDRALRHIDHITREVLRRGDYFTADSSSLIYLNNPSCVPDPTNAGGYLGSSYYGSVTQVTDCDPKHDPGIDISSPSTNWAITDLEVARQKQSGVFPRLLAPLDDVVGVIQLGVGGAWGEFHRSSGALIGSPNAALLAQRLHTAFNPSASAHQREVCSAAERRSFPIACASAAAKAGDVRAVSMRTPGIQRFVVGDGLTGDQFAGSTNANDPAYGFFDDCFVANSHHMGTFGVTGMVCRPGSQSRNTASTRMSTSNAAFKQECFGPWDVDDWTWATIHGCCPMSTGEAAVNNDIAYLTDVLARPPQRPYGGETCAFNWPVSGCQNTLASLQRFRVTYLNLDYNVDVIGQWKWEGCYEEVTRRMGYRLVLVSAELPGAMYADSANAGSVITITMRNVGFAAPIFSRVPFLIMHRRSDGLRFATPVFQDTAATKYEDIRYWMPGQLITIKALMRLDKVPPGSYDLRLWIPDVHAHKRLRPEYSIRFANPNVWNAATGDNTIASNLQVLAGGGGGTSSEGSAFEQLQSLQRRLQEQQDVVVDEQGRVVNMTGRVLLDREPQRVAFAGVAAFDKEPLGYIEVMPLVRSGDLWYYANCTADRFHGMVPYYMPAYDHNHWDVGASPLGRCNASVCKPNADHPIGTHLDFTSEGPGFQNPFIMKHLGCFGEYNWWDTVTLYARKQFQTEVPCDWSSACLLNVTGRIVHTGGAVVRVNGIEVYRHLVVAGRDLPANAPANGTATQATPVEAYFQVPNSAVRCGTNLMAVEVRSGQRGEAAWDDVLMDVDLVHSVHRSCRNSRSGYGGNYTEDFTGACTRARARLPLLIAPLTLATPRSGGGCVRAPAEGSRATVHGGWHCGGHAGHRSRRHRHGARVLQAAAGGQGSAPPARAASPGVRVCAGGGHQRSSAAFRRRIAGAWAVDRCQCARTDVQM